jgi:hypothetical protein
VIATGSSGLRRPIRLAIVDRVDSLPHLLAGFVGGSAGFGERHILDGAEPHHPGASVKLVAEQP